MNSFKGLLRLRVNCRLNGMPRAGLAKVNCGDVVGIDFLPAVKVIEQLGRGALRPHQGRLDLVLLKQPEQAIKTLRRAVELGYRDFRYMKQDRDLDAIRRDPRFKQLLREYENR